jgi:hypothetical protein
MIRGRVRVTDQTAAFTRRLTGHMDRNTGRAARLLKKRVVKDITQNRGTDNDADFITVWHGGMPVSVMIHPGAAYVHSQPFDPPFYVHRDLANSYRAVRAGRMEWLMGSDNPNSLWQEFGTTRQLPRPHLRRNLLLHRADLAAAWTRPM